MIQSPGTIAVVDYGMGNLRSVWQALRQVAGGREVCVTADPAVVAAAERVVFPGQGAMPDCMHELDARGLRQAVLDAARNKPFLGICIGLQMLFERSEEGDVPGLGCSPGRCSVFPGQRWISSRCRTWAGTPYSKPARIRYGTALPICRASTSCIVIMSSRPGTA